MRKSSELTLWLQVAVFTHFIGEKWAGVTTRPPFRDTPCEKGWSHCYVGPLLSHFSRHIPPRSGLPLHGHSSPRCCVARSLTRFVANDNFLLVLSAIRLGHLVLSQHIQTDVSSHSTAEPRDKLHLTRHHPIRAQNFTIWSHSTAQVPCSCLASTCSDVSIRPPCFEMFVMEGHNSTISQF